MELKYTDDLIPVVVVDHGSREVLMVAYANREAVDLTRSTGYAHYYSRSRRKIWKKGEESGHLQRVVRILVDCDEDTLLYEVEQQGAACHTGHYSCFYRTLDGREIARKVFDPEQVYRK
ncbi:MAG: phosphoribosyl-AMP cyclohydrolase [Methanomicrobiales archaeon]|nr:phosphoribosyl-AMP cyclohydrolase [Methanomicrobiales archaeon]MDD1660242.1 phosphoribosyl-AMP cyclohydrolase [Methanomicrobiales archaeon]